MSQFCTFSDIGFTYYAAPDVTLEDDLKRRDLTINALAQDDNGEIIDPYNGLGDLQNRLLDVYKRQPYTTRARTSA